MKNSYQHKMNQNYHKRHFCALHVINLPKRDNSVSAAAVSLHVNFCDESNPSKNGHQTFVYTISPGNEQLFIQELVGDLDNIVSLQNYKLKWLSDMQNRLEMILATNKLNKPQLKPLQQSQFQRFLKYVKQNLKLVVIGFGLEKLGTLYRHLMLNLLNDPQEKHKIKVIKKGEKIKILETSKFIFLDARNFVFAHTQQDTFLKSWTGRQMVIEPIIYQDEQHENSFPPKETVDVSDDDQVLYNYHYASFYLKRHYDSHYNMKRYIIEAATKNAQLLSQAVTKMSTYFYDNFGIDIFEHPTISSIGEAAMYKEYDTKYPKIHSLAGKLDHIQDEIRAQLWGGLTILTKRHMTTNLKAGYPYTASHAPCGDPYKIIEMHDFNALYTSCLKEDLPCGLPILFEKRDRTFYPKIMRGSDNFSMECLEWLDYIGRTDARFVDKKGQRRTIHHALNYGEVQVGKYTVDGHIEVDGRQVYNNNYIIIILIVIT